jgi:predicted naringenin-chalcone synthase
MVSVEICSLHLQTEPTRDNILANTIFADGAAAALFSKSEIAKLNLISTDSVLFENSANAMGWKIGNFGFEMMLSSDLPKMILEFAVPKLLDILKPKNLSVDKIKYWALHPGGRAILDSLQQGLKLDEEKMHPSKEILKNYGNMSSASILFVLKEIIDNHKIKNDEYCCAVAFGPGLTMEVAILKGA